MMTFSPLLQVDDGLYQCVVAEGAATILSVDYKMQVNCEYTRVVKVTVYTQLVSNMFDRWTHGLHVLK